MTLCQYLAQRLINTWMFLLSVFVCREKLRLGFHGNSASNATHETLVNKILLFRGCVFGDFWQFFFSGFQKKSMFLSFFLQKTKSVWCMTGNDFFEKSDFFVRFCPHFWRCLTTFLIHFWKWVLPCKNVQKDSILELIQSTFGHDLLEFVTKKYFISKEKFFSDSVWCKRRACCFKNHRKLKQNKKFCQSLQSCWFLTQEIF